MKRLTTLILIALSSMAVTACGIRGGLERPPPLWGDPPAAGEVEGSEDATTEDEWQLDDFEDTPEEDWDDF